MALPAVNASGNRSNSPATEPAKRSPLAALLGATARRSTPATGATTSKAPSASAPAPTRAFAVGLVLCLRD